MSSPQRRNSMRERYRELVREDVQALALKQLAEGGAQAISLKAIAKEIGVSAPALYRYYANRDELLNTLVVDAYIDLRDNLAHDAARAGTTPPRRRLRLLADAYRRWANAHPHRYELLFKPPFPGYDAHIAAIAAAGSALMDVVLAILIGADPGGEAARPDPEIKRTWDEPVEQFAVRLWTRLHGFVDLELGGAYTATAVDADALFDAEATALAEQFDRDVVATLPEHHPAA